MSVASGSSRAIFATPNRAFSSVTQRALRSPISAPSCRVNSAQMATQTVKMTPALTPFSSEYDVPGRPVNSRKIAEPTMAVTTLAR